MNDTDILDLARALDDAWTRAETIPAPTVTHPSLTIEDAYSIQEIVIGERLQSGQKRAGWKMGLTSAEPPATPIVGTLLSDMVIPSGSDLDLAGLVDPMVEAELVVRIGETIDRPQTVTELAHGPHHIGPGIEVVDYRTTDSSGVVDWIADNSTVAFAVVGDLVPLSETQPGEIEVSLYRDGSHLATGAGSQVMGNPLAAVAWLSSHLAERGRPLERGHVVLTGSLTGHHPVPGAEPVEFVADFGPLGTVAVGFHG